jgi:hypothetical protein
MKKLINISYNYKQHISSIADQHLCQLVSSSFKGNIPVFSEWSLCDGGPLSSVL